MDKTARLNYLYALAICLLPPFFSNAQRADLITKYADGLFENAQYQKAINAYKEVLEQDPGHGKATFQLGEAYRLTFDYESAEYYYGQQANQDPRYPLSGYYYAGMLKYKGMYPKALDAYRSFDNFLKVNDLHESKQYRYYYKQAKVEIDGCQLAINQSTLDHPDHQFELLGEPLNSPYNDYAAFTISVDSVLCLTSARRGGKGKITDNEFGESLVDLFRFTKNRDGEWENYNPKDKFEIINTKWGEGSGSFNRDRTKFYYTNCNGDLGDFCHIYVSYLVSGRWSEPEALNFNINEYGYDSQHPSLTTGGDTLFYVSDKEGGEGGFDIWMSVNAGNDSWGPSVNLGDAINTPFNEFSPFFDQRDNTLWFASDGHRGFGGYDIYIARGESFRSADIFNAGLPFNSPKDDIFFFLGDDRGYLTSNRDGGMGKFDIWGFNIASNFTEDHRKGRFRESDRKMIAGRNALFTEDYNFDNRNTNVINQIISKTLASNITGAELMLTEEQLAVYNSLSLDDKERIEKIVKARMRKMTSKVMRSIRSEDDFYYQELPTDRRKSVDRLVSNYIDQNGLGLSVTIGANENFYNSVENDEREKIDMLISERIKSTESFSIVPMTYNSYGNDQIEELNGIASKYLLTKKEIGSLPLSVNEKVFMNKTGNEDIEKLSVAVREKMLSMSGTDKYRVTDADRNFYQQLTRQEKDAIKSMAHAFLVSDLRSLSSNIDQAGVDLLFRSKDSPTKARINRLILKQMANLTASSVYFAEATCSPEDLQRIQGQSEKLILNDLITKYGIYDADERITMEVFVKNAFNTYQLNSKQVFLQEPTTASTRRNPYINERPKGDPAATLSSADISLYNELPVAKQKLIDRIIALEYLEAAYRGNSDLATTDEVAFKQDYNFDERKYVETLSKDLTGAISNNYEKSLKGLAFTYYNNLAPVNRAQFNRVMLSNTFDQKNGKYVLSPSDARQRAKLSQEEKNLLLALQKFRNNNERILTENLAVEAKDIDIEEADKIILVDPPASNNAEDEIKVDLSNVVEVSNEVRLELPVLRNSSYDETKITGILTDSNGVPLAGYPIKLKEHDKAETVIESFTDESGFFAFNVRNDEYNISINEDDPHAVKLTNVDIRGISTATPMAFQNTTRAYFDMGSASLRPETKKLLDEIVAAYRKSPIKIEIESHTDATGSENRNIALSEKRGFASFDYLVAHGVEKSDVSVIWHGQERPIAYNTNPAGRQLNRRIDIRLATNTLELDLGHFFLIRPGATLYSVAKNVNLSVEELKAYNGLTSNVIASYQPIRVKKIDDIDLNPDILVPADISVVKTSGATYTVQTGDTLYKISGKFNVPEELILEVNELSSPSDIAPGMRLSIYPRSDR